MENYYDVDFQHEALRHKQTRFVANQEVPQERYNVRMFGTSSSFIDKSDSLWDLTRLATSAR